MFKLAFDLDTLCENRESNKLFKYIFVPIPITCKTKYRASLTKKNKC